MVEYILMNSFSRSRPTASDPLHSSTNSSSSSYPNQSNGSGPSLSSYPRPHLGHSNSFSHHQQPLSQPLLNYSRSFNHPNNVKPGKYLPSHPYLQSLQLPHQITPFAYPHHPQQSPLSSNLFPPIAEAIPPPHQTSFNSGKSKLIPSLDQSLSFRQNSPLGVRRKISRKKSHQTKRLERRKSAAAEQMSHRLTGIETKNYTVLERYGISDPNQRNYETGRTDQRNYGYAGGLGTYLKNNTSFYQANKNSDGNNNYFKKKSFNNDLKTINRKKSFEEKQSPPLPIYPSHLPLSFGYTSTSRLQPPDAGGYRDQPLLNDKFFPRDPPWNEDTGIPMGFKSPHFQVRGVVVETRGLSDNEWTPLLDGISLEVKGGELLALMTTSDIEGTCFLDLLGGKIGKWGGRWKGEFILNGNRVSPSKVASRSSYMQQDVNFCPDMSVRQTMLLHSSLRECADNTRVSNIKAKINALIEDLGLEQVKHTRVQDLTLSEKRRLNVACHLLLETDIVLLDQPTKGMDIFDTFFLVELLRQWAARGRIIILTIQPPTYEIFTMISRVALISTGQLMYYGKRREMLPYFAYIEYPCPAYKNPSDYYIDLLTLDDLSAEAMLESSQRVEMLAETFRRRQEPLGDPGPPGPLPPKIKHSNVCIQLLFLWIRAMIYQFPYNMLHFLGQAIVAAIISVITGAVYLNERIPIEYHQGNLNNRVSFYYFMSGIGLWPLMLMTISEMWRDRLAVERDISDGLYSRSIYILTKMSYSFPTTLLIYLAYILPAYSMMAGLSSDNEEGWFYLYVGYQLLYLLSIRSLALASTVIFDSRSRAASLTGFVVTVLSIGSGYTIHPKDFSSWTWPTLWWSPERWFLREMVFEEFNRTSVPFTCSRNPVDRGDIVKKVECGVESGAQALRYFGLSEEPLSQKYYPAVFIFIFYGVFLLIYLLGFIFSKKPKRAKRYTAE